MGTKSNHFYEEQVLVQECIDGHRRSQQKLYNIYAGKMYAMCLRYAGNSHDAQDILQNGFINIFKNLNMFVGKGSFEGWMKKIMLNCCLSFLKRQTKTKSNFTDFDDVDVKDKDLDGFDKVSMKELMIMIQSLPDGYRTVVNLYMVEGFLHREIADMLGISEGTSKSQLARGKMALQMGIEALIN